MRLPPLDKRRVFHRGSTLRRTTPSKGHRRMGTPRAAPRQIHGAASTPQKDFLKAAHSRVGRAWHWAKDPGWQEADCSF